MIRLTILCFLLTRDTETKGKKVVRYASFTKHYIRLTASAA